MMKLAEIARLIELAIDRKPPKLIADICGEYYQPYYHLMFLLATRMTSGIAVELGVNKARGVVSMALGCAKHQVIGLDHTVIPEAREAEQKFDNLEICELSSMPVPEFIVARQCPHISLLHIDTEHSYSMAKFEFESYEPYLLPGAVVLFDDLHAQEGDVLRYFMECPHPKIQDDRLHPVNGYGVVLYV